MRRLLGLAVGLAALGCSHTYEDFGLLPDAGPTATGGEGGTGGGTTTTTGGGGAGPCVPRSTEPCYPGPAGTDGIGACKAGARTCKSDGSRFGPCLGAVVPGVELCATDAIDESCDGDAPCTGAASFGKVFSDAIDTQMLKLARTSSGDVVLAAASSGAVDFGAGAVGSGASVDVLVARFDATGNHIASAAFGDPNLSVTFGVAATPDEDAVVVGAFEGTIDFGGGKSVSETGTDTDFFHDVFVAKLDPALQPIWAYAFGDASDQDAFAVDVGADGAILVAGDFEGTLDFGVGPMTTAGGDDVFVAKLDASGAAVWSSRFGDFDAEEALGVSVAGDGRVYLCGDFNTQLEIVPGMPLGASALDGFVALLEADGTPIFSRALSSVAGDTMAACDATPDGGVVAVGWAGAQFDPLLSHGGGDDAIAVHYGALGNVQWAHDWGDGQYQRARGVAVDDAGHAVVVGTFAGTMQVGSFTLVSAGSTDAFVVKLAPDGTPVWAVRFGDVGGADQVAMAAATAPDGSAFVAGWMDGSFDVPGGPITAVGILDPFLLALAP